MSRRHDALIPLTHDHHHALHEARVLKQAAALPDEAQRTEASRAFIDFFHADSVNHFREEEEQLFPVVALEANAPMDGIVRVLTEHVRLHALVRTLGADPSSVETMTELAGLLRAHVRFEEDELFPAIERVASEALDEVHLEPQ
jgi:hemerythrin-like domain-containing protein